MSERQDDSVMAGNKEIGHRAEWALRYVFASSLVERPALPSCIMGRSSVLSSAAQKSSEILASCG